MDGIIGASLILGAYFLPGIVASARGHHNAGAIWLLTLLTGWTGVLWLFALVWSATAVRATPTPPAVPQYSAAYRELAGIK